jgi:hypothetical protein
MSQADNTDQDEIDGDDIIQIFRSDKKAGHFGRVAVTRQMVLPTSSTTSNAPRLSMATPTGRPIPLPFSLTKPVRTSTGSPETSYDPCHEPQKHHTIREELECDRFFAHGNPLLIGI